MHEAIQRAFDLVIRDDRQDQLISRADALYHVWQTVDPRDVPNDSQEPLDVAYRVVLEQLERAPSRGELLELIRQLSSDGVVQLDDLQEFWAIRAKDGDL